MSAMTPAESDTNELIVRGTVRYKRTVIAVFAIGTAVMTMLYSIQPIMRSVGLDYGVPATQTAFLMSATTVGIALFVLLWGALAARTRERPVMLGGLFLSVVATVLIPVAPTWEMIILLRAIQGVSIAGPAAVTLAWIANHVQPTAIARVSGYYIAATTVGGMTGRLLTGWVNQFVDWRAAIFVVAGFSSVLGFVAHLSLPRDAKRREKTRRVQTRDTQWRKHQRHISYAMAFFAMMVFVGMFNVLGYRLAEKPWLFETGAISLFFLTYLAGTVTSSEIGEFLARWSPRRVMAGGYVVMAAGVGLTFPHHLGTYILGLVLMCGGYFTMHSLASSRAAYFHPSRARGSGTYLMAYYLGSSCGAFLFGMAWDLNGWTAVMMLATVCMALALPFVLAVANNEPSS